MSLNALELRQLGLIRRCCHFEGGQPLSMTPLLAYFRYTDTSRLATRRSYCSMPRQSGWASSYSVQRLGHTTDWCAAPIITGKFQQLGPVPQRRGTTPCMARSMDNGKHNKQTQGCSFIASVDSNRHAGTQTIQLYHSSDNNCRRDRHS